MNKLYLSSALLAIFALPAFADINKNASTATCDSATIGATSGSAYMDTDWTANTINLQWYSNGEQIDVTGTDSATCRYDSTITLPSDPDDRTGYTFGGWQVRVASNNNNNNNQTPITLSSLYATGDIDTFSSRSLKLGVRCEGMDNGDWYGTDQQGEGACSDSRFSGLNNGEWRVTMPNGTVVKGVATCSTTSGNNHSYQWGGNSSDWELSSDALQAGQYSTDNSSGMQYCWCKPTGADTTGNGTYQSVAGSRWVFASDSGRASGCVNDCALDCAARVRANAGFRRAVFGISE